MRFVCKDISYTLTYRKYSMPTCAKIGHMASNEINKEIWWPIDLNFKRVILSSIRERHNDSEFSGRNINRVHTHARTHTHPLFCFVFTVEILILVTGKYEL
jgi:hypothetical protein